MKDLNLPEFNKKWLNHDYRLIKNNASLRNLHLNKDFVVIGSGPSLKRFDPNFLENKKSITLCGANLNLKGNYYIPDSTPYGWNNLRSSIDISQNVLMPYTFYNDIFNKKLSLLENFKYIFISYIASTIKFKWYQSAFPYFLKWKIEEKKFIPTNTGAQSAALGVSIAIIMGAKKIYLIGVDGFYDLIKSNKDVYSDNFSNYFFNKSNKKGDENLKIRKLRDRADRYIFSLINYYCKKNNISIELLNKDSHLNRIINLSKDNF